MAVFGLRFCARALSSCGKWGPLFIAVRGPLTIAASLVAEHRLQTRRLSNCGSRAQLLRGMWDLPGPGFEHMSPALAGGFLTTAPPGKPQRCLLYLLIYLLVLLVLLIPLYRSTFWSDIHVDPNFDLIFFSFCLKHISLKRCMPYNGFFSAFV